MADKIVKRRDSLSATAVHLDFEKSDAEVGHTKCISKDELHRLPDQLYRVQENVSQAAIARLAENGCPLKDQDCTMVRESCSTTDVYRKYIDKRIVKQDVYHIPEVVTIYQTTHYIAPVKCREIGALEPCPQSLGDFRRVKKEKAAHAEHKKDHIHVDVDVDIDIDVWKNFRSDPSNWPEKKLKFYASKLAKCSKAEAKKMPHYDLFLKGDNDDDDDIKIDLNDMDLKGWKAHGPYHTMVKH